MNTRTYDDSDVFDAMMGISSQEDIDEVVGADKEFKSLKDGRYVLEFIDSNLYIVEETQKPLINTIFKPIAFIDENGNYSKPNNFSEVRRTLQLFTVPHKRTYHDDGERQVSPNGSGPNAGKRFDAEQLIGQGHVPNSQEGQFFRELIESLGSITYFQKNPLTVKPLRNDIKHTIYSYGDEKGSTFGTDNAPEICQELTDRLSEYKVDTEARDGRVPFASIKLFVADVIVEIQMKQGKPVINDKTGDPYRNQNIRAFTGFSRLSDADMARLLDYEMTIGTSGPAVLSAPEDGTSELDEIIPF